MNPQLEERAMTIRTLATASIAPAALLLSLAAPPADAAITFNSDAYVTTNRGERHHQQPSVRKHLRHPR